MNWLTYRSVYGKFLLVLNKTLTRILVVATFAVVAGCSSNKEASLASAKQGMITFGDEVSPAIGHYNTDAEQLVLLVDQTKDLRLLREDLPTCAYVSKSGAITFTSEEYFSVIPTVKGKAVPIKICLPGEKIAINKRGVYTVLVYGHKQGDTRPLGKDYVFVSDEKGLELLLKEVKRRTKENSKEQLEDSQKL